MHETLRWWLISWENNFPIHLVKILDDEVKRFSKKWLNDDEFKNSRNNRRLLGENVDVVTLRDDSFLDHHSEEEIFQQFQSRLFNFQ